jgi:hypothetical protein
VAHAVGGAAQHVIVFNSISVLLGEDIGHQTKIGCATTILGIAAFALVKVLYYTLRQVHVHILKYYMYILILLVPLCVPKAC